MLCHAEVFTTIYGCAGVEPTEAILCTNYTRKMKTNSLIRNGHVRLASALVVEVHARSIRVLGNPNSNPTSV